MILVAPLAVLLLALPSHRARDFAARSRPRAARTDGAHELDRGTRPGVLDGTGPRAGRR